MADLLSKISSYNLFNYLFTGVLFVILAENFTAYTFQQENAVLGFFLYYFIGLTISRLGSLIIEPILKKTSFLKFADYKDFVAASKVDPQINIFSEVNNMYRTISMVMLGVILLRSYESIRTNVMWLLQNEITLLLLALFIMFILAYRKQTAYITKRVNCNK